MPSTRRKFLMLAGGGVIVAAGAAGAFLTTRTPHSALKPWEMAGNYGDPREKALSYALLAPNPHNRQPWFADLRSPGEVTLLADTDRLLKETDPFDRQIIIGFGCFLELMVQAANAEGYRVDLELFPQGSDDKALDNRPIAVARFVEDAAVKVDPLFEQVLDRRTIKDPYDTNRPVDGAVLDALTTSTSPQLPWVTANSSNDANMLKTLRRLTWDAFEVEYRTPPKLKESVDLMRMGKAEIEANPDGIDLGGGFLESLMLAGMLNRESLADPGSSAFQQGLDMYRPICESAMGYMWLVTPGNSRRHQIEAGRAWVRANLAATARGVGLHPLSQALQEYIEMEAIFDQTHLLLAPEGGTVQMLGRVGYAKNPAPSPRWALEHKLVRS